MAAAPRAARPCLGLACQGPVAPQSSGSHSKLLHSKLVLHRLSEQPGRAHKARARLTRLHRCVAQPSLDGPSTSAPHEPPVWDIVGLGQAMVDFAAAVDDSFLDGLGMKKGSRR